MNVKKGYITSLGSRGVGGKAGAKMYVKDLVSEVLATELEAIISIPKGFRNRISIASASERIAFRGKNFCFAGIRRLSCLDRFQLARI